MSNYENALNLISQILFDPSIVSLPILNARQVDQALQLLKTSLAELSAMKQIASADKKTEEVSDREEKE